MTCDYWNEIWLNEGFATYFEDAASDALLPSYGILDTFYPYTTVGGLVTDARSQSTHALSMPAGVTPAALFPGCALPWQEHGACVLDTVGMVTAACSDDELNTKAAELADVVEVIVTTCIGLVNHYILQWYVMCLWDTRLEPGIGHDAMRLPAWLQEQPCTATYSAGGV